MASADGNLAATYTLIHAFLLENSHEKVAKALKKAAKDVVILRDEAPTDSPPLNEIIAQWKTWKESKARADSSSSSSDGSDSSDSSSSSDSGSSDSSSGSSDSSSSEDTSSRKSPESSESSSESEEDPPRAGLGFSSKPNTQKKPVKKEKKPKTVKPPSSSTDESSSEASESTPMYNGKTKAANGSSESKAVTQTAAPVPVSKIDDARVTATKRRRTSLDGSAVATAITIDKPKGHEKERRKTNVPFQRIKAVDVTYHDDRLKDNTFVARNGAVNDYGAKAHRDLIVTRGDGFRKEKNKKKRGSYRGGEITMESHSIKFA